MSKKKKNGNKAEMLTAILNLTTAITNLIVLVINIIIAIRSG